MQGHLILTNCLTDEVTRPNIERALKEDELLWLDLEDTGPDTIALLREVFKIHPLAIEDAQEFNQRPKIEDYDDFVSLVAYGARGLDQPLVEVHASTPSISWSPCTATPCRPSRTPAPP